jgi:hypothetical protein
MSGKWSIVAFGQVDEHRSLQCATWGILEFIKAITHLLVMMMDKAIRFGNTFTLGV